MFQCMVSVWLVRSGSRILWKMLELDAGGSALHGKVGHVLLESLCYVLCGCGGISFRDSVDR